MSNKTNYQPTISLICPVYNPTENYLKAAIESVLNQTYPQWELCIADDASTQPYVRRILEEYEQRDVRIKVIFRAENGHISRASNSALQLATGEFIGLLDHDDLLTVDALEEVVKLLNQHPEADLIYSDEDKVDDQNRLTEPTYKPDWCPDSFLSRMYTCHLGVYRRSLINEIGGFRVGFEGSQDYDLVLRFTEKTDKIFHIPKILYHWRIHPASAAASVQAKSYAYEAADKALRSALERRSEPGQVIRHSHPPHHYTIRYDINSNKRVSIIILNRDFGGILNFCLSSIFNRTIYPNYEVIVIDNGSIESETEQVIAHWKRERSKQFKAYRNDQDFNYSKLNNDAVRHATGDYLIFLNNDTKVITKDWINALVEQTQRPSVGAVSGLLLYPDQSIQQAGFVLDQDLIAYPIYRGLKKVIDYESLVQLNLINNISAVSGSCLACHREKFEAVGGFDENLPLFYNDIDLCLKFKQKGYHNVILPHVQLFHQELKSWNVELLPEESLELNNIAVQFMQERWKDELKQDRCLSLKLQQKLKSNLRTNQDRTLKNQPLVSVCIPTYNGEKYLKEALESVLAQTYSPLEVIISDDGSTDNTLEICRSFSSKFSGNFKIFSHANYGLAVNWNYAISQAEGKYIKLLFQDDLLEADCISKLVDLATQNEQIGLVFSGRGILIDEEAKSDKICQGINASARELEKTRLNLKPIQDGRELLSNLHLLNPPLNKIGEPSTVLIKKSVFDELGYFDPELKQLVDVEMWLRIMGHYKIGFINENLSDWRIHPQQLTVSNWLKGETRQDLEKFHQKICQSSYLSQLHPQVKAWIQNPTQAQIWMKWLMGEVLPPSQLQIFTEMVSTDQINSPETSNISHSKLTTLHQPEFKVSAIISTYKAEKMLLGRLENLVNQTLFKKGQLEIIVIDSGSPEREGEIVLAFQEQYPNSIVYLRTQERETIYAAWNRGIAIARGQYITNQNTDDRLKSTALERLATYLDEHETVALVHAEQQAIPDGEVVDLEQLHGKPHWKWSGFSRLKLLFLAQVGSQPMWRKSLHAQYGLFDEALKVRGDQDFYIRIANAGEFHFIPEILGTLNLSENSLSHQQDLSRQEEMIIFQKYTASREKLSEFLNQKQVELTDQNYQILVNNFCCDLAAQVLPQFHLPFYLKLVTDLLNFVADLGIHQQIIQTNLLRIWNRFADPSTRFQFMKSLSPQVIETCDERIQLKGEEMEKINESEIKADHLMMNSSKINPILTPKIRPFWSVVIPTYNGDKYIEQTLHSLLSQNLSREEMEILVVDDFSPNSKIETLVQKLGQNRVKFYRQPQNLGLIKNWNDCIQRSTGEWVHILHQDDLVLPGFYTQMRELLQKEQTAGAAFCRHYYIDEQGNQRSLSTLEQETPGIIPNWLERIAVMQRIQFAAIVVKRSVYEQLGGFSEEAGSAADWEMWKRIAAFYPVAYQPQPLACYRLHSTSESSRLIQTATNISDTRKSIEMSQSYLPQNQAAELSNKAKEHYAFYALNTAKQMLSQGQSTAAIAQIQEALNCSQSNAVKEAIIQLFIPQKPQLKTFTPAQILAETSRLVGEYRQQPNSDTLINELRKMRQIVAQYWLGLETDKLETIYSAEIGQAHQLILNSGIKNELLTPEEKTKVEEWKTYLDEGWNQPKPLQNLLALMLYCYSHQLPANWYVQSPIPKWFVTDYFKYMLAVPQYFQAVGEADQYYRYIQNWLDYTTGRFFSEPNFKLWQELAWLFTQTANFIPLYFNTANLKNIYIKRSEMMTFALKNLGHKLDYQFSNRPDHRSKIRLGILSNHFSPQTETYSTLPVFEHLDRTQFEVILYAVQSNNHPLEQYCSSRIDRFVKLPKNLPDQVQLIRNDDLDILLIGSNVTAVTHSVTLLALHRLARIQVTSTSSCVTTGMPTIDCYISGTLTEPQQNAQEQYSEKLIKIEGTAHCFSYYSIPSEQPKSIPTRATLGITDDAIVFISGANFYKVIPEVRETWAKILAAVPNSVLVLYPFNPNWTSHYAGIPFIKQFQATFAQYNVESQRLIFLQPQPSRADIKEYLKLADIYLDSYPFSGVNSLVDPLEVSLVPIVQDGDSIPSHSAYSSQSGQLFIVGDGGCFRSLMGASLLRSLSIPDLIANSEEAYIKLAVTLAKNPQLRQQKQQEIQQKMQQNPEFLDSGAYSAKMGQIFHQLFQTWQQEHQSWQLDSREALQHYLSKLVSAVNAYDLERNHQLIIAELRKIRRVLADSWLTIPPEQLEKMYQSDLGKGYQILLNRGIQREPLTETEQYFLTQLTQQAIGLKQENALNCLMVCMLYYPPGRMLVQDAETRLPDWLIKDYKRVFETSEILEKVQPLVEVPSELISVNNPTSITTEAFQNRLLGCINLYRIDPTNGSVIEELQQIRQQMADFWLRVDPSKLALIYQNSIRPLYQALLTSGFPEQPLTESEQQFLNYLINEMSQNLENPELMNFFLAIFLYCRPGQMKIRDISRLPEWFREDYLKLSN